MELAEKIQINLIPDEEPSLHDFVNDVANEFDEEEYLITGLFSLGKTDGKFKDSLWAAENEITKTNIYFDFTELNKLKFKNVRDEDILLIKSWIADYFIDEYQPTTIGRKYKGLLYFVDKTDYFSQGFFDESKGNNWISLREELSISDNSFVDMASSNVEFLSYVIENGFGIKLENAVAYINKLQTLMGNIEIKRRTRELPKNSDALKFGYYIDVFFNDNSIPQDLKTFYMPIQIWWKIGNVIPIRPSELCTKMERDCLLLLGEHFYIKINRVKRSNIVRVARKRASLPTLNKLKLSTEIYDLINNYIKLTNEYGETKTLFSYIAQEKIRDKLYKEFPFLGYGSQAEQKIDPKYFTRRNLESLLKGFYKSIVQAHYQDTSIEDQLRLHDLRHYAFTSLMLQGLTPVEMALIGGHKSVISQLDYQSNVSYYIDNEIVNFVNASKLKDQYSNTEVKKIVFSMPKECPTPLEQCTMTEDGIGYCSVNFEYDCDSCENDEFCFKCKNWWCAPSEYSYDLLRDYIKRECIAPLEKKVEVEEKYLQKLITSNKPTNLDGELRANIDDDIEYKTVALNLKRDVDTLIDLKEILLDITRN